MSLGVLNFININNQEDLDELTRILSNLDLIDAISRKRQMKLFIEYSITHEENIEVRYQIRFLNESIRAYILGLDEAAIYYSSLSVELALVSKLFKKLGCYDKKMGSFKDLINACTYYNILNNNLKEVAHKIRMIRNCYIHYGNWIGYTRLMFLEQMKFIKNYKDKKLEELDRQRILETISDVYNILEEEFPAIKDPKLALKKGFMEILEKGYEEWLKNQGIIIVDVAKMDERESRRYGRQKYSALTTIQNSVILLQFLFP